VRVRVKMRELVGPPNEYLVCRRTVVSSSLPLRRTVFLSGNWASSLISILCFLLPPSSILADHKNICHPNLFFFFFLSLHSSKSKQYKVPSRSTNFFHFPNPSAFNSSATILFVYGEEPEQDEINHQYLLFSFQFWVQSQVF
jgi:hypothetical protein